MILSILIPSRNEPKIQKMIQATEEAFPEAQIIISNDRYGKGKGWALRQALNEATGDVIAFIDGDLDIAPRMLNRMIPFLEDYDIVIGKKQIRRSLARRLITRLSRIYMKAVFGIDYDTQTGIKLFHRYALLPWKTDSFAFDLEIILNARNAGLQIIEVPVEVTDHGSSCKPMKLKNVFRAFNESLKILFNK